MSGGDNAPGCGPPALVLGAARPPAVAIVSSAEVWLRAGAGRAGGLWERIRGQGLASPLHKLLIKDIPGLTEPCARRRPAQRAGHTPHAAAPPELGLASWWDSRALLLPGSQEGRAQREGGEPGAQGPSSTHLCKHACPGAPRIWGPGRELTRLSAQAVSRGLSGLVRAMRCSRPLGSPPAPESPPHPGQAGPSPRQLTKPAARTWPYCSAPLRAGGVQGVGREGPAGQLSPRAHSPEGKHHV